MRIMLIPVGEQTQPLYEGFRHYGNIDKIVLLYTNKTYSLASEIKSWATKMIDNIEMIETDAKDIGKIIEDVVTKCPETIDPDVKIIANLSGGTKPMSHACYVIASISGGESFYIFLNDEGNMEFVEMPRLDVCLGDIFSDEKRGSRTRMKILRAIHEGHSNLTSLARKIGIKKPSVLNHIRKLVNAGLVAYNGRRVELTATGKLVLRIKHILDAKLTISRYK